jgi:hypothetical protein
VVLTPPVGAGWTAELEFLARRRDGTEVAWTQEVNSTAVMTVTPSLPSTFALAPSTAALLIVHVTFFDPDGLPTPAMSLGGRVVEAGPSGLVLSKMEWEGRVGTGLIADPHQSIVMDEEVAR